MPTGRPSGYLQASQRQAARHQKRVTLPSAQSPVSTCNQVPSFTTQRDRDVPTHVIEPLEERRPAVVGEVLGGAEVEPRVKFVDDEPVVLDRVQADHVGLIQNPGNHRQANGPSQEPHAGRTSLPRRLLLSVSGSCSGFDSRHCRLLFLLSCVLLPMGLSEKKKSKTSSLSIDLCIYLSISTAQERYAQAPEAKNTISSTPSQSHRTRTATAEPNQPTHPTRNGKKNKRKQTRKQKKQRNNWRSLSRSSERSLGRQKRTTAHTSWQ